MHQYYRILKNAMLFDFTHFPFAKDFVFFKVKKQYGSSNSKSFLFNFEKVKELVSK